MRNYVRAFVYFMVACIGALIIVLQVFPEFDKSGKSIALLVVGAILLIDGIRSLVNYLRRL